MKIIDSLKDSFVNTNETTYEIVEKHDNVPKVFEKGLGIAMTSECVFVLRIKGDRFDVTRKDIISIDELNGRIIRYFRNNKIRYLFHSESPYSHFIYDKTTRNKIQLVVDPDSRTITLYPSNKCTGQAIRDLITRLTKKIEASIENMETSCITY
jgi:hypothetical protein